MTGLDADKKTILVDILEACGEGKLVVVRFGHGMSKPKLDPCHWTFAVPQGLRPPIVKGLDRRSNGHGSNKVSLPNLVG